jgi:hydroxymethylpyrimidine pyrophosphatase-like HAD family hydrolase
MGNASTALKTYGFHVTATSDEGGLAEAIGRFIFNP